MQQRTVAPVGPQQSDTSHAAVTVRHAHHHPNPRLEPPATVSHMSGPSAWCRQAESLLCKSHQHTQGGSPTHPTVPHLQLAELCQHLDALIADVQRHQPQLRQLPETAADELHAGVRDRLMKGLHAADVEADVQALQLCQAAELRKGRIRDADLAVAQVEQPKLAQVGEGRQAGQALLCDTRGEGKSGASQERTHEPRKKGL